MGGFEPKGRQSQVFIGHIKPEHIRPAKYGMRVSFPCALGVSGFGDVYVPGAQLHSDRYHAGCKVLRLDAENQHDLYVRMRTDDIPQASEWGVTVTGEHGCKNPDLSLVRFRATGQQIKDMCVAQQLEWSERRMSDASRLLGGIDMDERSADLDYDAEV